MVCKPFGVRTVRMVADPLAVREVNVTVLLNNTSGPRRSTAAFW
jgi:hypothetical protein